MFKHQTLNSIKPSTAKL